MHRGPDGFSQNVAMAGVLICIQGTTVFKVVKKSSMLASRAFKPLSSQFIWSCLNAVDPFLCHQHSSSTFVNAPRRFSSSSWKDFASAPGSVALQTESVSKAVSQPAAELSSVTALSQKQKKVIAVVERAVHSALAQAVAPSHLSRCIAFLSLNVVTISRDCYVVTMGWDCSGDEFSSVAQQHMQVRGLRLSPIFCQY